MQPSKSKVTMQTLREQLIHRVHSMNEYRISFVR